MAIIVAACPRARGAEPPNFDERIRDSHALSLVEYGKNVLRVSAQFEHIPPGQKYHLTLTPADAEALAADCPSVGATAPIVDVGHQEASVGNNKAEPNWFTGTNEQYLRVRDWEHLKAGDNFTEKNIRQGDPVCLLGQTTAGKLFHNASPIGQQIGFKDVRFRVIGVLDKKGRNTYGFDLDDVIVVPWTAIGKLPDKKTPELMGAILVKAKSTEQMPTAAAEIEKTLRERHHIASGDLSDFQITDDVKQEDGWAKERLLRSKQSGTQPPANK